MVLMLYLVKVTISLMESYVLKVLFRYVFTDNLLDTAFATLVEFFREVEKKVFCVIEIRIF